MKTLQGITPASEKTVAASILSVIFSVQLSDIVKGCIIQVYLSARRCKIGGGLKGKMLTEAIFL